MTLEAGEPLRLQPQQVDQGVRGIETLMHQLGMIDRERRWSTPQPVFYESYWVRSDHGGILLTLVRVGDVVTEGTVLGTITDPITNVRHEVRSPYRGRILGMALNQVVMPGFAAFRVGIQTTEEAVQEEAAAQPADEPSVEDTDEATETERPPPERAEETAPRTDGEDAPEEEAEESDGKVPQAPVNTDAAPAQSSEPADSSPALSEPEEPVAPDP